MLCPNWGFSAEVANSTGGNATLAAIFTQRAEWIRSWYLEHLWNDEVGFLGVYKTGASLAAMTGCSAATRNNATDPMCCCVRAGSALSRLPHYVNFSICPTGPVWPYPSPGNISTCASLNSLQTCSGGAAGPGNGKACTKHSSRWPCGEAVSVRELLGLGPA